jgi:hypothetical protein
MLYVRDGALLEIWLTEAEDQAAEAMPLDLSDEETSALVRLLTKATDADRFPLSPRVQT